MPLLYQTAREEARKLLEEYWDGQFPVRLGEFTEVLGADKFESPIGGLSGLVTKAPGRRPRIVLNSAEPLARRRFTWGHELGHIVERRDIARDDDYSFMDTRADEHYDLHEFFADEFSGALLMPEAEIIRLRAEGQTRAQMARTFEVSVSAVTTRLERLDKNPPVERVH